MNRNARFPARTENETECTSMSTQTSIAEQQAYTPGFHMAEKSVFKSELGLSRRIVEQISAMKDEPTWMRTFPLRSLELFEKRPVPTSASDPAGIDCDNPYYAIKP